MFDLSHLLTYNDCQVLLQQQAKKINFLLAVFLELMGQLFGNPASVKRLWLLI